MYKLSEVSMLTLQLKKIEITNFRSIQNLSIPISMDLKTLVGKNESGKTNILLALNALDPKNKLTPQCVKMGTLTDKPSRIKFLLSANSDDVYNEIKEEIISNKSKKILKKVLSDVGDFLNFTCTIDVRKDDGNRNIVPDFELNIPDDDYYIVRASQGLVSLTLKESGQVIDIDTRIHSAIVEPDLYVDTSRIEITDSNRIKDIFMLLIKKAICLPGVLFWKYSDEYLLPGTISTAGFVNNPDSCIPLKNLFAAVGINDIKQEYDDKILQDANAWPNFLNNISEKMNSYVSKIWKTKAKLEIQAFGNDNIKIAIKDSQNSYSLSERSDGYKRMLTFIAMISTQNSTDKIKNKLILIDEPDATVDIPGTKFLLKELIKLSSDNYAFISTHSPSMIDPTNVSRHLIVEKKGESTECKVASETNYFTADTLNEGLGMDYYKYIEDANVAFEGWTDKKIFDIFTKGEKTTQSRSISATFTGGVDKFMAFASLWMLLTKKTSSLLLLSDSDQKAIGNKKKYDKQKMPIEWKTYQDICGKNEIRTAEDFLKKEHIVKITKSVFDKEKIKISFQQQADMENINSWHENEKMVRSIINKANRDVEIDDLILKIKRKLYERLSVNDIKEDYVRVSQYIKDYFGSNNR